MISSPCRSATFRRSRGSRGLFVALALGLPQVVFAQTSAPFSLDFKWAALADPAGQVNGPLRNGIASTESAEFSRDGQYIVTVSKADGRMASPSGSPHDGTAHMRLWDLEGNMIWDVKRSRGPLVPATGRPNDQPSDRVDEMENAAFSRDDRYIAAVGDDSKVEIWQVRDLDTHAILPTPTLVRTFNTAGCIDSVHYTHEGSLLMVGAEDSGTLEIFRVQGDPGTWQSMRTVNHNTTVKANQAINSLDTTADGRYIATAGTDQRGVLWEMDVTRDSSGLITDVQVNRLATMTQPTSTTREMRFQPDTPHGDAIVAMTAEHDQATYIYRLQDLVDHAGPATSGPDPIHTLRASNTANKIGNPTEAGGFTPDGKYLIFSGKTRADAGGAGSIDPAFLRVYETKELSSAGPEPDPIYVRRQDVYNTEYLSVNPAGDLLTTAHHDGSVRLWDIHTSGAETIASEGFNEPTDVANRWTLRGPRATTDGAIAPGSTKSFGTSNHLDPKSHFIGHRGSQYISMLQLGDSVHTLTMNEAWDLSGSTDLQVQFAAAASLDSFGTDDFLRLRADLNGDNNFDVIIAEFVGDAESNRMVLASDKSLSLNRTFTDFYFDLEPLLPTDFGHQIRFQLEASSKSDDASMGFDSLRVTGSAVPEPGALSMLLTVACAGSAIRMAREASKRTVPFTGR